NAMGLLLLLVMLTVRRRSRCRNDAAVAQIHRERLAQVRRLVAQAICTEQFERIHLLWRRPKLSFALVSTRSAHGVYLLASDLPLPLSDGGGHHRALFIILAKLDVFASHRCAHHEEMR